jgi:hypothetical protein
LTPAARERVQEFLRRGLIAIVIGLPAAYLLDYVSLRFGLPPRPTFDVVEVDRYYTVPRKDGKLEYYPGDPVEQKCVRSLFPHMGQSPCWFVRRSRDVRVNL